MQHLKIIVANSKGGSSTSSISSHIQQLDGHNVVDTYKSHRDTLYSFVIDLQRHVSLEEHPEKSHTCTSAKYCPLPCTPLARRLILFQDKIYRFS